MFKTIASVFIITLFISSLAWAQGRSYERTDSGQQQGQGRGHRMGPPLEAISACDGQSDGASCSFESPHGTLSGTCATSPKGDFACRPANHPEGRGGQGGPGMGPPPEQDAEQ